MLSIILHGAKRPLTILIADPRGNRASAPSESPRPLALLSLGAVGAGLRRSGALHLAPQRVFIVIIKAPCGRRGRCCAASDYDQNYRPGDGTAAGAAVPITFLTWWSLAISLD